MRKITVQQLTRAAIVGALYAALTLLASAFFKTVNRRAAQQFSPFERTFMVLSVSAIFFTIMGMQKISWNVNTFVAPLMEAKYLISVLSLSLLCSIGANMLVNYAAGRMSVAKMSAFSSLITLCSTFGGIVFLREPFSAASLLGTAMIIYGIWQVTRPDPEKKTE